MKKTYTTPRMTVTNVISENGFAYSDLTEKAEGTSETLNYTIFEW